jgi:hypothetical protein
MAVFVSAVCDAEEGMKPTACPARQRQREGRRERQRRLPALTGRPNKGERRERGKCGRAKKKNGPAGRIGKEGREKGRIPFSFSEMTFPNTFSNDFQSLLAFG